jgi:hypothetical protein
MITEFIHTPGMDINQAKNFDTKPGSTLLNYYGFDGKSTPSKYKIERHNN